MSPTWRVRRRYLRRARTLVHIIELSECVDGEFKGRWRRRSMCDRFRGATGVYLCEPTGWRTLGRDVELDTADRCPACEERLRSIYRSLCAS